MQPYRLLTTASGVRYFSGVAFAFVVAFKLAFSFAIVVYSHLCSYFLAMVTGQLGVLDLFWTLSNLRGLKSCPFCRCFYLQNEESFPLHLRDPFTGRQIILVVPESLFASSQLYYPQLFGRKFGREG